jgi:hypothetical protein
LLTEKKHTTTISDHNRSIPVSYELPLDILDYNRPISVFYELPLDISDHNRLIPVSYELSFDILDLNRLIPVSYELPFDLRQNSKSSDLLREPYFEILRFFIFESSVTQIPFFFVFEPSLAPTFFFFFKNFGRLTIYEFFKRNLGFYDLSFLYFESSNSSSSRILHALELFAYSVSRPYHFRVLFTVIV